MNIVAVNGGPRKGWNTARLLESVLEGAADRGMDTELVHLYDLDFKGCTSCFVCKPPGGPSYGRCAMRDGLTPLLDVIRNADALVIGSPVYLFEATGETRSFLERLIFQSLLYTNPPSSIASRRIPTALVYAMNISDAAVTATGFDKIVEMARGMMERTFGSCETLLATDTLQFTDYTKYETGYFDADAKQRRHREVFPQDLERARELGRRLSGK